MNSVEFGAGEGVGAGVGLGDGEGEEEGIGALAGTAPPEAPQPTVKVRAEISRGIKRGCFTCAGIISGRSPGAVQSISGTQNLREEAFFIKR